MNQPVYYPDPPETEPIMYSQSESRKCFELAFPSQSPVAWHVWMRAWQASHVNTMALLNKGKQP